MNYKISEEVSLETVDGQMVLVTDDGDVAVLNETGAHVMSKLKEKTKIETILEHICENYDVDEERLQKDINGFLLDLKEKGFIEKDDYNTV